MAQSNQSNDESSFRFPYKWKLIKISFAQVHGCRSDDCQAIHWTTMMILPRVLVRSTCTTRPHQSVGAFFLDTNDVDKILLAVSDRDGIVDSTPQLLLRTIEETFLLWPICFSTLQLEFHIVSKTGKNGVSHYSHVVPLGRMGLCFVCFFGASTGLPIVHENSLLHPASHVR